MRIVTKSMRHSLDSTRCASRPCLDFANDICLVAYQHIGMLTVTEGPSTAPILRLKISTKKGKHIRMNRRSDAPITLHGNIVKYVNGVTHLGYEMATDGD